MEKDDFNLDWLISSHGQFLSQFGIDRDKIVEGYHIWKDNNKDESITQYFCELLRQGGLYIAKSADSEIEYYSLRLQLDTKMLEYSMPENKNDVLRQIHFDELMISNLTLPFKFDVQINSSGCCSYCSKKDKKTYSFEKILEKKYLPFSKCKNENGYSCSYSIVPLIKAGYN